MTRKRLTDQMLKRLKADGGEVQVWDTLIAGLGVRVYDSGRKVWFVRYRSPKGRQQRRMTIGTYSTLSLKDARKAAKRILGDVAKGKDPAAEKAANREGVTFGELADRFLKIHASQKAERTRAEYGRMIEHDLRPRWGRKRAADITRADIMALLDHVQVERKSPTQAHRLRALVHLVFAFGVSRDLVSGNPCSGLGRIKAGRRRDRVLSDDEVKALWTALDDESEPVRSLFRFLLVTGQRGNETRLARWKQVRDGVWEIPAENTKANRAHRVPLPPLALRILEDLKPATGKSAYLFETSSRRKKGPIRWVSHATARIRESCGFHFRAHDLRRTCGTGMARLGVDRLTIAKALNHKSADATVTAIYDRYAREPEVREALVKWGAHLEGLLSEDESKIAGRIG